MPASGYRFRVPSELVFVPRPADIETRLDPFGAEVGRPVLGEWARPSAPAPSVLRRITGEMLPT